MVEWSFDEKGQQIKFLIKTMKKKHLEDTLKMGKFCFSFPEVFNSQENLAEAQQDRWDSHLSFEMTKLYAAPIISQPNEEIKYGEGFKLAERAQFHYISNNSKASPLCSFRKVDNGEIIDKCDVSFFQLGDVVDRIINEFQHDAFVLILKIDEFINRLWAAKPCIARSIHYGEIDEEFEEFLNSCELDQKEMFQKSVEYEWQKEFRVVLAPRHASGPQIVEIGSIEDIAFGGDIELLRQGFMLGKNKAVIQNAAERIKVDGDVYDQLRFPNPGPTI